MIGRVTLPEALLWRNQQRRFFFLGADSCLARLFGIVAGHDLLRVKSTSAFQSNDMTLLRPAEVCGNQEIAGNLLQGRIELAIKRLDAVHDPRVVTRLADIKG